MTRKPVLLLLAVAIAVPFAVTPASGSSDPGARASATKRVSVEDDRFSPSAANVNRGDKVVWRWKGFNDHNVRFRKVPRNVKRPKGSAIQSSGRFARTFKKSGTFRYVCTIHEDIGMKGRVVVD